VSRGRRRLVKALVVLGSLLAFLSVCAIWVERQALDTDDWVATSDRLIENETIRAAVADYLVDQLYANVDVEKEIEGKLPSDVKEFAGPVSSGLRQVAGEAAGKVLETSTAQSLWEKANRTAHEQLKAVLEEKGDTVSTEEGTVTLNLGALLKDLAAQIGIGESLAERLPPDAAQIEILHSDELDTAQDIVVAVKGLALALSILTFVAFAAAIYLSRGSRWVTVLFSGIGLVTAGFAVIVARQIAGGIVVDQLVVDASAKPAGEATWSIATTLMVSIATTVIVIGLLFALAGWLASPTGSARACRRAVAPALRDYVPYVYAGLAVLVCIYFLAGPSQNLRSFLTTLIVAGMAAFGIHELRRQTAEEFPDASFEDTFGRTRKKVVSAVREAKVGERAAKLRLPELRLPKPAEPEGEDVREPAGGAPPAPAPSHAAPARDEDEVRLERLERLAALHEKGALTDEEFAAEKARLLGGG